MDLMSWFVSLGHWNWFIAAAVLFVLEVMLPGTFMLWLGLAAILVGTISLFVEWEWQAQLIAFAIFAVVMIPAWRRFARKVEHNEGPFLNRRAEGYVGRVFTLEKPIVGGMGTLRIDDTIYRVSGPDSPAGARVKIAGASGSELQVEMA